MKATFTPGRITPRRVKGPLAHPNIQVVNLKSRWKPFQIVPPRNASIAPYTGEKTFAMFEWWNHWPVTQVASSGISAVAPDRASHSSLSHLVWEPSAKTPNSITKIMLAGMTTKSATELLPLAKSWLSAPAVSVEGTEWSSQGYDQSQRAFVLARTTTRPTGALKILLNASPEGPLVNPAFVIKNWGDATPTLTIDGQLVNRGSSFDMVSFPISKEMISSSGLNEQPHNLCASKSATSSTDDRRSSTKLVFMYPDGGQAN